MPRRLLLSVRGQWQTVCTPCWPPFAKRWGCNLLSFARPRRWTKPFRYCVGQTAVSGGVPKLSIERFCNDVASEYLLPQDDLAKIRLPITRTTSAVADIVGDFARRRKVSASMVAYRLYRLDMLSPDDWQALSRHYRDKWVAKRDAELGKAQGGPDYYSLRRHRLGTRMLEVVSPLVASGDLTTTKAGRLLAVGANNVHRVLSVHH